MKKLLLGAAIATALIGNVANAAIVVNADGTPTAGTMSATTQIFLSGSSALQELVERSLLEGTANAICKSGTVRKYIDAGTNGSNQAAYLCELNAGANQNPVLKTLSTHAGWKPNLLLYKRNQGGSLQGTVPVANSIATEFLNVSSNTGVCTPQPAGLFAAIVKCDYDSSNNVKTVPTFGLADVNPKIFTIASENAPAGTPALTTGFKTIPSVAAVFGVVVTTKLRNALQQAQFSLSSNCNPKNAGYTSTTAESAVCTPNLQTSQIAAIFAGYPAPTAPLTLPVKGAGKLHDWTQIKIGSGGNLFANTIAANKPSKSKLHICSRTIGSGTKAQFGVRFLNNACNAAGSKLVQNADYNGSSESTQPDFNATPVPETAIRPMVHAMASSGGLAECLTELDSGTGSSGGSFDGSKYDGSRWAIGYQSLDKNATRSAAYRFIKIDGVLPTLQNIANGRYHDWVEAVYVYRSNLSGDTLTLVNEAINSFGKPSVLGFVNTSAANHSFGKSGFLAVPNAAHPAPLNGLVNAASPINPLSYAIYPGTGANASDNCRNPLVYSTNPANNTQGLQLN
jgi:hypothetical protein